MYYAVHVPPLPHDLGESLLKMVSFTPATEKGTAGLYGGGGRLIVIPWTWRATTSKRPTPTHPTFHSVHQGFLSFSFLEYSHREVQPLTSDER